MMRILIMVCCVLFTGMVFSEESAKFTIFDASMDCMASQIIATLDKKYGSEPDFQPRIKEFINSIQQKFEDINADYYKGNGTPEFLKSLTIDELETLARGRFPAISIEQRDVPAAEFVSIISAGLSAKKLVGGPPLSIIVLKKNIPIGNDRYADHAQKIESMHGRTLKVVDIRTRKEDGKYGYVTNSSIVPISAYVFNNERKRPVIRIVIIGFSTQIATLFKDGSVIVPGDDAPGEIPYLDLLIENADLLSQLEFVRHQSELTARIRERYQKITRYIPPTAFFSARR